MKIVGARKPLIIMSLSFVKAQAQDSQNLGRHVDL